MSASRDIQCSRHCYPFNGGGKFSLLLIPYGHRGGAQLRACISSQAERKLASFSPLKLATKGLSAFKQSRALHRRFFFLSPPRQLYLWLQFLF